MSATSSRSDIFLTKLFNKNADSFGMKVEIKTISPIVIKTELVERFPSDPVWYLKFINPIANIAYEPNL